MSKSLLGRASQIAPLMYIQGYSIAEIAKYLNRSKSRIQQILVWAGEDCGAGDLPPVNSELLGSYGPRSDGRRQRHKINDTLLRDVAAAVADAVNQGIPVADHVAARMHTSKASVGRWIREAKDRGYIAADRCVPRIQKRKPHPPITIQTPEPERCCGQDVNYGMCSACWQAAMESAR